MKRGFLWQDQDGESSKRHLHTSQKCKLVLTKYKTAFTWKWQIRLFLSGSTSACQIVIHGTLTLTVESNTKGFKVIKVVYNSQLSGGYGRHPLVERSENETKMTWCFFLTDSTQTSSDTLLVLVLEKENMLDNNIVCRFHLSSENTPAAAG